VPITRFYIQSNERERVMTSVVVRILFEFNKTIHFRIVSLCSFSLGDDPDLSVSCCLCARFCRLCFQLGGRDFLTHFGF
jgi:hypothetical protein